MLKPYICVTCERVIIEQVIPHAPNVTIPETHGPASLIGLFSKMYVTPITAPSGESPVVPPNAILPREWAIYTEWNTEPGDENRRYVLAVQIFYPDQTPFGETTRAPINVEPNRRSQSIVRINGFPVGQAGMYTARVWIEEDQKTVAEPINLSIELIFLRPDQNPRAQP